MSLTIVSSVSAEFEHAVEVEPLFRVQRCVPQQTGHADDAVHRLADLMAHDREECRPCQAGTLGALAAPAQPKELALRRLRLRAGYRSASGRSGRLRCEGQGRAPDGSVRPTSAMGVPTYRAARR